MKNYMIVRFFNNGFAQIETANKTYDMTNNRAELELRNARNEFNHEYYQHYSNGDVEYFFD